MKNKNTKIPVVLNLIATLICFLILVNVIGEESWRIIFAAIGVVSFASLSLYAFRQSRS